MRIVKCPKCNHYLHNARKCYFCGTNSGFIDVDIPTIHENTSANYARVVSLVENKKYTEALSLAHAVIEWMPHFSGIFWLRLLAKNRCSTAAELIQKGFDCEVDPDFYNALAFSNDVERSAYMDIRNMVLTIQRALSSEVLRHEYRCKMSTKVLQIHQTMRSEIELRKKNLVGQLKKLETIEQSMYAIEKDCILLCQEHNDSLDNAAQTAATLKTEIYRLNVCTAEDLHKYRVQLGCILQQSEQAKSAIEGIKKQHPWVKTYNDLVKKRDEQVLQITNEISSLKIYEATVQQTLDEIDSIEQRHQTAIRSVESFDFLDAANLLGRDCFVAVLRSAGFFSDVQTAISSQEWQPDTMYVTPIDTEEENDDDDYFSAWGLPNDSY